jgi:hypothetical protein
MTKDLAEMPMQDRYQHLHAVISGKRFLNKQGLANEMPFFSKLGAALKEIVGPDAKED